ncbi:MAG: metallophosphoesterase [Sphingomicrobium sp.]
MVQPWFRLAALALVAATGARADVAAAPAGPPPFLRIIAVGDLHGDFAAWTAISRDAGLTDAKGHWAGGKSVLVQTGDVVDRGPDSLDIIHNLQSLQREAPKSGGRVVALVGNHEAMNMTGDLRYVSASDYATFADARSAARRDRFFADHKAFLEADARKRDPSLSPAAVRDAFLKATPLGMVEHAAAWAPTGAIGKWVLGNDAVAVVAGTLFVHGGISPKYASLTAAEINRRVRAALAALDTSDAAVTNDELGPLWYRGLILAGDAKSATPEQQLTLALKGFGVARMVVGHTPIISGISIRFGGRLVDIDTGISSAYGGKLSYLEIIGDKLIPHEVRRPSPSGGGA